MTTRHRACDDFRQTSASTRRSWVDAPLTRRRLIAGGLGATLAVYAARAMPLTRMLEAAEAQAATAPNAPILVSVFLPGGVDLLDTLVPQAGYGAYADLRKGLKLPEVPALGSTGLGLHPALGTGARGGVPVQRDEADPQPVHRGDEASGLGEGGAHLSPDDLAGDQAAVGATGPQRLPRCRPEGRSPVRTSRSTFESTAVIL